MMDRIGEDRDMAKKRKKTHKSYSRYVQNSGEFCGRRKKARQDNIDSVDVDRGLRSLTGFKASNCNARKCSTRCIPCVCRTSIASIMCLIGP